MKRPKFVVYKAADGYRWRLVAANGRIVADSGEAYTRKRDAYRATVAVKAMVRNMNRQVLPVVHYGQPLKGWEIGYAIG